MGRMDKKCSKLALPVQLFLAMLLFVLLALPSTSSAAPILKLEFKALPDIFISGATLDLPLYLVENRDATESSRFSGYASSPPVEGPFPLASIHSELTSTQSRFVSFTPLAGFDIIYNTTNFVTDHEIGFDLRSTNGILVVVDNSGIVGRTEILIGTVRLVVGPPIPQDDGIGGPDPAVVFWADLSAQTNHSHNASLYLGPSGTDNVGELALGGIYSSTYKILEESKPTVTITANDATATEKPLTTGQFTVKRTGSTNAACVVHYAVGGAATPGDDYVPLSGSVTIGAGLTKATLTVTPVNDTDVESPETVVATLSEDAAYTVGIPSKATVTIVSDDLPPKVQFSAAASAGAEAMSSAVLNVTLSSALNQTVTVNYATANGTAVAGSDYSTNSGTLTFIPGETSESITVAITNDTTVEPNETFTVTLTAPVNATLGAIPRHTHTILNDDPNGLIQLSAAAYSFAESSGTVSITATRTGGSGGIVGVELCDRKRDGDGGQRLHGEIRQARMGGRRHGRQVYRGGDCRQRSG